MLKDTGFNNMKLAIASGKGGTGKTTLSVALAQASKTAMQLLDCDVEEPNGHIFIKPKFTSHEQVGIAIPSLDEALCTNCGKCGEICQFSAIVTIVDKTMIFGDMCHSCGGCILVCPQKALHEQEKVIGSIDSACACGRNNNIEFIKGTLNIGQAMAPPVIRAVKKKIRLDMLTIIDCPPGTSCPMITAVTGSDFVILVTEPTPFGLHDLILAVETMRSMALPFGVVVNRAGSGDNRVSDYCSAENIPLLLQIADDRRVANAYSRGEGLLEAMPELAEQLRALMDKITSDVDKSTKGEQ
jgi:MinD superfamily P-loop ATPase